jgi:hypothetical protein
VLRHAPADPWQPAPRGPFGARRLPAGVAEALQRRELGPGDLALLASLDAALDLPAYLCVRPAHRARAC